MFTEDELPQHLVPAARSVWNGFAKIVDELETKDNDDYIRLAGHIFERVLLALIVHLAEQRVPTGTIVSCMFDTVRRLQDSLVFFARARGKENAGDSSNIIQVVRDYK